MTSRRAILAALAAGLMPRGAVAADVRRIGILMAHPETDALGRRRGQAIVEGLRALGWSDGDDLHIDWRWAGGDPEIIARGAAELVAQRPDVLVGMGSQLIEALRRRTSTIPIVFVQVSDPVGQGFVANFGRPGGNVTGITNYDPPMAGKWVQMLTQINPPAKRIAVLFNPTTTPYIELYRQGIEDAAAALKTEAHLAPCLDDAEIEATMAELARGGHGGALVLPEPFTVTHRTAIIAAAARNRVPAAYPFRYYAADGGLMAYGVDDIAPFGRIGEYVDRILKGAKPGDLPVQRPPKFHLVVNMKTAKALGIDVSPSLLATADEVIE